MKTCVECKKNKAAYWDNNICENCNRKFLSTKYEENKNLEDNNKCQKKNKK